SQTISEGDLPAARGLPVWLIVLTLASVALFVAGLVVFLSRGDAGETATPATGSTTPEPTAVAPGSAAQQPAGMVLVKHPDGKPWFYVDEKPVTLSAYRSLYPDHQQPGGPDDPVVMISYDEARSYAKTKSGRLLRSDEWDAATVTPGVVVVDGVFEWVESP